MLCSAAIESQNPWMIWAGRNLRDYLVSALLLWGCCTNMCLRIVSSFLPWEEHLPLDQMAQNLTQLGPEHCQGWDIHNFLGQTVTGPHHPLCKNCLLMSSLNLSSFSLKPLSLILSQWALPRSLSLTFLQASFKYKKNQKILFVLKVFQVIGAFFSFLDQLQTSLKCFKFSTYPKPRLPLATFKWSTNCSITVSWQLHKWLLYIACGYCRVVN